MLNSYDAVKRWILSRAAEFTDDTSDYETDVEDFLIAAWRDLWARHRWLSLRAVPPGVILTAAKITGLTLTATAGSSAASLSAAVAVDLDGYVLLPTEHDYLIRVLAHTPGSAALTLDAVPDDLAAAPVVIAKHEYALPADCGPLLDALKTRNGTRIDVVGEDFLDSEAGVVPGESWPPRYAARVGKRTVRFSSYPPLRERIEVPYQTEPADPAGTAALVVDGLLPVVWANLALSYLYEGKGDTRLTTAEQRAERGILQQKGYEHDLLAGLGTISNRPARPRYAGA